MIRSPRDKDTEAIWQRRYVKKLSPEFSRLAYNKLALINAAETINDLGALADHRWKLRQICPLGPGQEKIRLAWDRDFFGQKVGRDD